MALDPPGARAICARQRSLPTADTSILYSRPLIVSSKRWKVTGRQHSEGRGAEAQAKGGAKAHPHAAGSANCGNRVTKIFRRVRMSTSFPLFIHMFSTGQFRRALATVLLLSVPVCTAAQDSAEQSLYRVFLRDGTNVV